MERIWLKQYPAGVPAISDVTQYSSLVELLEESLRSLATASLHLHGQVDQLPRPRRDVAGRSPPIYRSKGLQKGARVALMMPNVLQYPVSTAAVLRAGYAVVNVNPLYTPRERGTPTQGFRRRGDHRARELRDHRAASDRQGPR